MLINALSVRTESMAEVVLAIWLAGPGQGCARRMLLGPSTTDSCQSLPQ